LVVRRTRLVPPGHPAEYQRIPGVLDREIPDRTRDHAACDVLRGHDAPAHHAHPHAAWRRRARDRRRVRGEHAGLDRWRDPRGAHPDAVARTQAAACHRRDVDTGLGVWLFTRERRSGAAGVMRFGLPPDIQLVSAVVATVVIIM